MNMWTTTIIVIIVVGMLGLAGRAFVQSGISTLRPNFDGPFIPNTTVVVVAVTENLPKSDLDIVIQRRATMKPHDVILVRPGALQPALLAQAVETLQATRRSYGRLPTRDLLVTIESPGCIRPPRADEAVGWVKSLQAAKPMDLPGVEPVPMIMLHPYDREIANNR